jgi:hypothetical protein
MLTKMLLGCMYSAHILGRSIGEGDVSIMTLLPYSLVMLRLPGRSTVRLGRTPSSQCSETST